MSINKKTTLIPESTREYTESIKCDLCGKIFKQAQEDRGGEE